MPSLVAKLTYIPKSDMYLGEVLDVDNNLSRMKYCNTQQEAAAWTVETFYEENHMIDLSGGLQTRCVGCDLPHPPPQPDQTCRCRDRGVRQ
jgi:hypothetical protein